MKMGFALLSSWLTQGYGKIANITPSLWLRQPHGPPPLSSYLAAFSLT